MGLDNYQVFGYIIIGAGHGGSKLNKIMFPEYNEKWNCWFGGEPDWFDKLVMKDDQKAFLIALSPFITLFTWILVAIILR